jgi:peptidyl-prolyl cis-trans isomerase SurA
MRIKLLFFGLMVSVSLASFAQNAAKEVLFTINQKPYYTDEFTRIYKKNLDLVKDESQKDLNQYLDLFIGYKLKVNRAYKLGLENSAQYQNELKSYRSQLATNYFNDTKITQELIEEGYNRLQKEVRASHILIMVDENAAPEDTLAAYKKMQDIRHKAVNGEDFGNLAMQLSQDPSAKENKGDLGYFSAFRMVYAFESAAYKTPKGQISKIFRTRFGYHILKVDDVRNNRGEVTVAHIMILNPKEEDADKDRAKTTIQDIYKKLQQGENFETLARQFSEDKSSAGKGGVLNKFSSGQLSSEEFENVAFSLTEANATSQPFASQFGWHIVKLIEKHPVKTLEEMKPELESKIGKDDRSKLIVASLNEKLKKKYTHKRDAKYFSTLSKLVTNDFYENKWTTPESVKNSKTTLLTINNDKQITGSDFMAFVEKQQKSAMAIKPVSKLVEALYEKFLDEQLSTYYNNNLENEFPEFANVMEEYRDGLLLFDLMEKEIWERSKTDTIGLKNFYDANKNNYMWKNRLDAVVASSTKMDVIKKVQSMLKKNTAPQAIKDKLNTDKVVEVMINSGIFEEGSASLPKNTKFAQGVSEIVKDGDYYFVTKVQKTLPETVKTFEECKGKLINDYQQYLEQRWIDDLRQEFNIKINQSVFQKVKNELKS